MYYVRGGHWVRRTLPVSKPPARGDHTVVPRSYRSYRGLFDKSPCKCSSSVTCIYPVQVLQIFSFRPFTVEHAIRGYAIKVCVKMSLESTYLC